MGGWFSLKGISSFAPVPISNHVIPLPLFSKLLPLLQQTTDFQAMDRALWLSLLLLLTLAPPALPKRGGGFSMGRSSMSRGSSMARGRSGSGGLFGGGKSRSSSGGVFGGSRSSSGRAGGGSWGHSAGQSRPAGNWKHNVGHSSGFGSKHGSSYGRGHS